MVTVQLDPADFGKGEGYEQVAWLPLCKQPADNQKERRLALAGPQLH